MVRSGDCTPSSPRYFRKHRFSDKLDVPYYYFSHLWETNLHLHCPQKEICPPKVCLLVVAPELVPLDHSCRQFNIR